MNKGVGDGVGDGVGIEGEKAGWSTMLNDNKLFWPEVDDIFKCTLLLFRLNHQLTKQSGEAQLVSAPYKDTQAFRYQSIKKSNIQGILSIQWQFHSGYNL